VVISLHPYVSVQHMGTELVYLDVYRFSEAWLRRGRLTYRHPPLFWAGQRDATPHTSVRIVPHCIYVCMGVRK